jgi:hypothetical protein
MIILFAFFAPEKMHTNEQRETFYELPIYALLRWVGQKQKSMKLSMFHGFALFCYSC